MSLIPLAPLTGTSAAYCGTSDAIVAVFFGGFFLLGDGLLGRIRIPNLRVAARHDDKIGSNRSSDYPEKRTQYPANVGGIVIVEHPKESKQTNNHYKR
jgi:hypothetical protein